MGSRDDFSKEDAYYMHAALDQAELALKEGEVPIGCVIVEDKRIIAKGRNATNKTHNGTRHAELVAIDNLLHGWKACNQTVDFSRCNVYVTCEPCIMCAAALSLLQFRSVVYGCPNDKFGGNGSILPVHSIGCSSCGRDSVSKLTYNQAKAYTSIGGLLSSEAISLLQRFYISGNPNAPRPHRPVVAQ